jgi:hypothetical protein
MGEDGGDIQCSREGRGQKVGATIYATLSIVKGSVIKMIAGETC